MKCKIRKLDKRFTYHEYFDYIIEFTNDMSRFRGPENYILLTESLRDSFEPSVELKVWSVIKDWNTQKELIGLETEDKSTKFCNKNWAYTTLDHDNSLKIYVKDHVLSWILLKYDLENTK